MSDISMEAALLLRARAIAARLGPADIAAMMVLVAAGSEPSALDKAAAANLRYEGCAAPVTVKGSPDRYRLEPLGELVGDILILEGRQIPGLGRGRRAGNVIYGTDGQIFASCDGGRWRVSTAVAEGLRPAVIAYFPELTWS